MSKKLIAANERQGIPTLTTIPKRPVLVKQIIAQIEAGLLDPIRHANTKNYSLGCLIDAIRKIAENGEANPARALANVREMASVCIDMSDVIGEHLYDALHEKAPTILAAVGGAA